MCLKTYVNKLEEKYKVNIDINIFIEYNKEENNIEEFYVITIYNKDKDLHEEILEEICNKLGLVENTKFENKDYIDYYLEKE